MRQEFGFRFEGKRVGPRKFGPTYVPEFQRILQTYASAGIVNVLEWGSGITTQILAAHLADRPDVEMLLTLDTNGAYQDAIFEECAAPPFVKSVTLGTIGPREGVDDPELAYSTYPLSLGRKFDFIFIDGRRRMECAFIASILSHPATTVVIHDYRRARYQPITALYDIVEDGEEFRVLRPRPAVLSAMSDGIRRVEAIMRQSD